MPIRIASLSHRILHLNRPLHVIRVAIVAAGLLALVIAWLDMFAGLNMAEREAEERIRSQAIIQARAAGETVQAFIERYDSALKTVRLAALEGPEVLEARGRMAMSSLPSDLVLQLFMIGRDGYLAYSSLGVAPRNFLGDREYFIELAEADDDRLVTSKPVLGRLTKQWSIQFARVVRQGSSFKGVVSIAVSPDVWAQQLTRFEVGPNDTLTLLSADGRVLLRTLEGGKHYGKQAPVDREYRLHPDRQEGYYVAHASVDGVLRLYGWSRLPSGLVMASGIEMEGAMAPVRELKRRTITRGVVSSLLLAFALAALLIALRRYERAVQRLGDSEQHHRKVLENMAEGLMVLDEHNYIVSVNPAFTTITGYRRDEVVGQHVLMLPASRAVERALAESPDLAGAAYWEGDFEGARPDGEPYTGHVVLSSVQGEDGKIGHRIVLLTDVTARRRRDDEIWRQANFDRLTELPNRALLIDRMESMLRHARRHGGTCVAVLFIDLDRFKPVNDEHGHDVGDLLLRQVAHRLLKIFRNEDTVSRIGGDEFVVVMQGDECLAGCTRAAAEVVRRLAEPFSIEDRSLEIGSSVGLACFPADGQSAEALISAADRAMYRAKNGGRGRWSH